MISDTNTAGVNGDVGYRTFSTVSLDGLERGDPITEEVLDPYAPYARRKAKGKPKKSLWQSFVSYSVSQKGRELTMGSSIMIAISMAIISMALQISEILPAKIDKEVNQEFQITMYVTSIFAIVFILTCGAMSKLTNDNHYKHRGKSTFIRGGMVVLGTGGIIYRILVIVEEATSGPGCLDGHTLAEAICASVFVIAQISLLLVYTKVRINNTLWVSMLGRFLIMVVIATNLVIWVVAVIYESVHEIHLANSDGDEEPHNIINLVVNHYKALNRQRALDLQNGMLVSSYASSDSDGNSTCNSSNLTSVLTPYLFPLMIEFAVVASTMCLAIWENCGVGLKKPEFCSLAADGVDDIAPRKKTIDSAFGKEDEGYKSETGSGSGDKSEKSSITKATVPSTGDGSQYYNSNLGFVLGWVVILSSVVVVIVVLYWIYSETNMDVIENLSYCINLGISLLCAIAIPITMSLMSKLTFKDEEIKELRALSGTGHRKQSDRFKGIHKALDKKLMFYTYLCLMVYKVLSMIAAYQEGHPDIFIDGLVCIIMGFMQVIFINFYGGQKRSTTVEDRQMKPGRQGLEFLRCANFALWLINTFLLKNVEVKDVQYTAFGTTAWAITSNIFQPLAILFYFHSMVCLADIITHSYSAKYLGLKRPAKSRCHGSKSEIKEFDTNL